MIILLYICTSLCFVFEGGLSRSYLVSMLTSADRFVIHVFCFLFVAQRHLTWNTNTEIKLYN